jgi:hypothetical protein
MCATSMTAWQRDGTQAHVAAAQLREAGNLLLTMTMLQTMLCCRHLVTIA